MAERLIDRLPPFAAPPTVLMVSADQVPGGHWVHHWHYPLPVTPLYADFEFGAHMRYAEVIAAPEFARIASLMPGHPGRARAYLVVDGYPYVSRSAAPPTTPAPLVAPAAAEHAGAAGVGYEWVILRRWTDEFRPALVASLDRFRAADLAALGDRALLDHIRELSRHLVEAWALYFTVDEAALVVRRRCQTFCAAQFTMGEAEFVELLAGASPATSEPVRHMEELAAATRRDPALLRALQSEDPWQHAGLRTRLAAYVEAHGHRATDWDYVSPTLAERPLRLVQLLREALERWETGRAGAAADVRRRREVAAQAQRDRLPDEALQSTFDALLRETLETFSIHEDNINLYNLGSGLMRYALLAAGTRFARRGWLSAPERVFFLRRPELEAALEGTPPQGMAAAADRRFDEHQRQRAVPPQPTFGQPPDGVGHAVAPPLAPVAGSHSNQATVATAGRRSVRGMAASPGSYSGPARIVVGEDQFDQVQPGDVLIAPQTTPSWTILFARIGALVTDGGGILSHSAIAAREFGIPAVVGTRIGTRVFRSGQTVQVDGRAGVAAAVTE